MGSLFTEAFLTSLVVGALTAGIPLLLAGLGEQISEKAGVLNIGIEGMMLAGSYAGFLVAFDTGSIGLGFAGGAAWRHGGRGLDGAVLRPPGPQPDRHRHRPDARHRGPDRPAPPFPVRPHLSAPARRRDPAAARPLLDPGARAGPVQPAADRLWRRRVGLRPRRALPLHQPRAQPCKRPATSPPRSMPPASM